MYKKIIITSLLVCVLVSGCKKETPADKAAIKAATYAESIELAGCSNLYKVSNALYRGAQPTKEGFKGLEELGIKTVVNLRTFHGDKKLMEDTSLKYVSITMQAWEGETKEVIEFLKVVNDPENHPVFVHCLHGADRTGTMVAIYRIVMQGWTKEKAIEEMTKGDYNHHAVFKNLTKFINAMDTEAVKKAMNE
jgi:protein tyrosine/serine phosphatase